MGDHIWCAVICMCIYLYGLRSERTQITNNAQKRMDLIVSVLLLR